MDYLPIFCQLQHKACLLVGGGEIAERKARLLLDAGAALTVNACSFSPQFHEWAALGRVKLAEGEFSAALLAEKWLVIAATDRVEVNALVYQCANQQRVFCNVVDDPKRASFIMPSIIDRSPIMVAVSSGGKAPVLARLLREKLEAMLPQHLGKLAQLGGSLRQRVKSTSLTSAHAAVFRKNCLPTTAWRSLWPMMTNRWRIGRSRSCLAINSNNAVKWY